MIFSIEKVPVERSSGAFYRIFRKITVDSGNAIENAFDSLDNICVRLCEEMIQMREILEEFIKQKNLKDLTVRHFWNAYDSFIKEQPEESGEYGLSDRESVKIEVYGYSFAITSRDAYHYSGAEETVQVYIDFFIKKTGEYIGRYTCIFDLHGKYLDDIFWS